MRFSNRTIYGLRAVIDLAYHGDGEPMQVCDIADRAEIPDPFLQQIFQDLKRADIVASKRGPGGGYLLAVSAEELTLAEVFEVLEAMPRLPDVACREEDVDGAGQIGDQVCREIVDRMSQMLEDVTIADLVERGRKMGLAHRGYEGFVYVI